MPSDLVATATTSFQVTLTWSASTDASGVGGYHLYRDGSATPFATSSSTNYVDNGLVPGTTYTYRVSAFDSAAPSNQSAQSGPVSVTTPTAPDNTAPSVPAGLAATATSPNAVQLSWNASTDNAGGTGVAGYHVFRNGGPVAIAQVATTSYLDGTAQPGNTYSYRVSAFDGATPPNDSAMSVAVEATTPPDATPPAVPTGLVASSTVSNQVNLSWNASTDSGGGTVAGYRIHRNGSPTALATVETNGYIDNSVVGGTSYSYQVRAFDSIVPPNESALSAAANVTTPISSVSGLDARPSNTSCLAGDAPLSSLGVERAFPALTFQNPVFMGLSRGANARWYVIEKAGRILSFPDDPGVTEAGLVTLLDKRGEVFTENEAGMLGLAFPPNFPTDNRIFVYYVQQTPWESRLSVFRTNDGGLTLVPGSENILFRIPRVHSDHNGGDIEFGPDGLLYIGTGDGGGFNDNTMEPWGNGQRVQTLLGKFLRIDVGTNPAATTYTIPPTNPYSATGQMCTAGQTTTDGNNTTAPPCAEIYAIGLRNPWRWSFDRETGQLWAGDVGQSAWEEVNRIELGGNYGWRCHEGTSDLLPAACGNLLPRIPPIAQFPHTGGPAAITGGHVYRGTLIPSLIGQFVFADYASGVIWSLPTTTTPTQTISYDTGVTTGLLISAFAEDPTGELYVVDVRDANPATPGAGGLYRLVSQGTSGGTIANLLSGSGCAASGNPANPSSGMIPYTPNAPFWSDGALKSRWLSVPDSSSIAPTLANGDWNLPNGSVLRKDFRLGSRLIETRLFMRHNNGEWAGYTYEWNAAQTDATRVIGGKTVNISGQDWIYPSEAQCLSCHSAVAGRSLSLETAQLNGNLLYATTGRTANQLVTLNHIGLLNPLVTVDGSTPKLPTPTDSSTGTVEQRARAWLHTNCAFCHQPGGTTPSVMDLRYTTAFASTQTCGITPTQSDLGLPNARIIAPGSPDSSVLYARISVRGEHQMPPLASLQVDTAGAALIHEWIESLADCN